jgi:penicillin-binding protein 2
MNNRITLKDPSRDVRIFSARAMVALLGAFFLSIVLLLRYFDLQITDYEIYRVESERNRVQLQPLPPKRGLIYDRNGVLLAENRPSFLLSIVIERAEDVDALLQRLRELVEISQEDIEKFQAKRRHRRPYDGVPLRFRLNEDELAVLAVHRHELPGVVIDAQLLRYYPYGELTTHALGYVARITERDLETIDLVDYRGTHHIGRIGIESHYEALLHGTVGYQNVETNAHGRVLRVLERSDPVPGSDIRLHLDIGLQQVAHDALGDHRGAVVALDPATGGVLALVSKPGYDGNLFVNGISSASYAALRESPDLPLYNRAIQGSYPPGSTIKPMIVLGALEKGTITEHTAIRDPGWYSLPGDSRRYRDWTLRVFGGGHGGNVKAFQAIEESCDVYFYDLAHRLGIDSLHDLLAPFALGSVTQIDTTHERAGVLPSSRWKRATRGEPSYPGETLSVGIGQGYMVATPLQLAVGTLTLATRGERIVPRFLAEIGGEIQPPERLEPLYAREAHWRLVHDAMVAVVHGRRGSARAQGQGLNFQIAGKTGTAQVIGIAQGAKYDAERIAERHRDHGLFIAFAPADAPRIALAVVVENGGGGASAAAPVARAILDYYLSSALAGAP